MNETMETATGPGAECAHVTVFWLMKSCRQMSPRDRSENKKKSYFHCTVIIILPNFNHAYSSKTKVLNLTLKYKKVAIFN